MVTGKGTHSTDISLMQFGIKHFFEIIETGSPAGPRKAQGIENVLQQWPEIKKTEVIYVGDAASDIKAARNVGIAVVAAAWAETAEPGALIPLEPDEIFYTIRDFTNWLYEKM